jgi:hypothetical protein
MAHKGVDPALLGLVVITIGAAVIGAILGAIVWTIDPFRPVLVVLAAIVLSTIVAILLTRELAIPTHRLGHKVPTGLGPFPQQWEQEPWEKQPYRQAPRPAPAPNTGRPNPNQPYSNPPYSSQPDPSRPHLNQQGSRRAEPFQSPPLAPTVPTHAVIAVDPPRMAATPTDGPLSGWWNQTERRPIAASTGPPQPGTPDISSYVRSGQIIQCTKCAAFTVDVQRVEEGFSFRCQACGHEFTWRRGEEWPAWKVSPQSRSKL